MGDEGIRATQGRAVKRWQSRIAGPDLPSIAGRLRGEAIYFILAALLIAASVAWRAGNLNAFSLSNDEGAYLMWAWLVHSGHPLYSDTVSVSAPFFIAVLDWAFAVAGVSLIAGRALVLGFLGLTLAGLIWCGKLLHDWLAGLLAALVFSLAPLTFVLSRMAVGEIPSVALATLSLACAMAYWRYAGWGWLALSGLTFSLSLLVKAMNPMVALPALGLIMARHTPGQVRWPGLIKALAIWALAGLAPILVCLLVYDSAALYDQAIAFRLDLRTAFPWRLSDNIAQLGQFIQAQWGVAALALAGLVLLARKARWEILPPLGLWLAGGLVTVLLHSPLFLHHTVILLPPMALLAGIGCAETLTLLQRKRWGWSLLGLGAGLAFLLALPGTLYANRTAQSASFGREADASGFLKQVTWPGDNVISDNLLLPFIAERQTPPPLGDVAQVAIDSGQVTSERLIAISEAYPVEAVANWALRLPYLKEYMNWVADNYLVRRVWDNYHEIYFGRRVTADQIPAHLDVRLGDAIRLLGYDVDKRTATPGSQKRAAESMARTIEVTLYWQTEAPLEENYTVFVQLLDSNGHLVTQHDGQPLFGYLPTRDWSPGDIIPDRHRLSLPDGLPAGRYQLIAGMYRLETLERLPVQPSSGSGAHDYVTLSQLEIRDQD
jgi:hypothetical protein